MFKNYLVIALRTLKKNKAFTVINVLGLAIGISASLVIYLLVDYHFSFDKFERDRDRIYRVVSTFEFSGERYYNSGVADPLGAAVKKEITGLESVISFRTMDGDAEVSVQSTKSDLPVIFKKQKSIVFADSNLFRLLGYDWLAGSINTAFSQPFQTVLTESRAHLYFPLLKPYEVIGKEIILNDTIKATVSGVVKDIKANTDFNFQTFIAYSTLESTSLRPANWDQWNSTNGAQQLLIKLAAATHPATVQKSITALYKRHDTKEPGDNSKAWLTLQPLKDLHFNADFSAYELPVANKPTLYSLLAIGAFLLILGCINFLINLSTAHAAQRAREIGIRKTMGSSKKQLVFQFLSETFLLTVIATLLSVALTPVLLKAFEGFMPVGLKFDLLAKPGLLVFLLVLITVVTLLSGFYPAMVLSSYKPVLVLKKQAYANTGRTRNAWLRKSLTISQFVIAQVFIMAAILVSEQISYTMNKDMGFKKDAIVFVSTNYYDTVKTNRFVFLDKLKSIPGIAMVSLGSNPPSSGSTWSSIMKFKDGSKEIETDVQQKFGDTNYIELFKMKLVAGTNLLPSDTVNSYIINETYARVLGFSKPAEAIGKKIEWSDKQIPIVGVVADFNQKSLHEPIKPLVIASWVTTERTVNIALQPNKNGNSWKKSLAEIEKAWKSIYPKDDFEYSFFDEDIAKFYTAEKNISSLLKWATALSVFISCLGLLGLVMFTTTQRIKEIGIRKVLGASVTEIVNLLSKDFVLLVVIAFLIATPIAYIGMHKWLQNFAYTTGISWWIFFLSGLVMTLVALLTVSVRTIQAAIANPVKSLRTE